nr:hypothetical protein Iba_chr03bCG4260 [Ipomoea batatas]
MSQRTSSCRTKRLLTPKSRRYTLLSPHFQQQDICLRQNRSYFRAGETQQNPQEAGQDPVELTLSSSAYLNEHHARANADRGVVVSGINSGGSGNYVKEVFGEVPEKRAAIRHRSKRERRRAFIRTSKVSIKSEVHGIHIKDKLQNLGGCTLDWGMNGDTSKWENAPTKAMFLVTDSNICRDQRLKQVTRLSAGVESRLWSRSLRLTYRLIVENVKLNDMGENPYSR